MKYFIFIYGLFCFVLSILCIITVVIYIDPRDVEFATGVFICFVTVGGFIVGFLLSVMGWKDIMSSRKVIKE